MASRGQGTLHRYLHSSSEPSTSGATSITESVSTSDLEISSDETSEEAEISSDETSEAAEPVPKRSRPRKSVAAHHRKTGISQTWTKEFKWLQKVRVNNKVGLVCKICHRHAAVPRSGSKVWTSKPCFHLRLDKIKQHAKSNMHKLSMLAEADTTVAISQAFSDTFSIEMKAAFGCLKCVYWLCKQEIAHTTTYPELLALSRSLGCDYFKALNVGRNATYTSPQIVAEFLEVIDGMVLEDVLHDMQESTAFSIMVDESTDVSILKQLVIYGRAVAGGKLKTRYLKIIDIDDGKAVTIVDALTAYLHSAGLHLNHMSSFGSDGASVMTGCRGGVAILLRRESSEMIAVHCICHRLALASGQASNQVKYLKQMKDHLLSLWKYFHFSTVRSAQLKAIQNVMDSPELKMVKAVDTRWLSHKAAVSVLLRSLAAVFVVLQQQVDPTAVGLRTVLARYNFFASLVLLNDVLSAVNRLSLVFQRSAIDLTIVWPLLSSTIETLEKLQQEPATAFEAKVKATNCQNYI